MNFFLLKATFLSLFFISVASVATAQDVKEYTSEIGLQAGGNIYAGDANSIATKGVFLGNLKNVQLDFGLFYRYKFNNRIAIRLGYDYTSVKGQYTYNYTDEATLNNSGISVMDVWGEYNFFELENNKYKKYSKTYSPYIFAGIGYVFMPNSLAERTYALSLPFGIGMKWILSERWNLNLQWTNRLMLSDNLEGLPQFDNPAPQTKSNLMNNDLLSGLTIGISFNFWEKGCNCHNNILNIPKKIFSKPLNNGVQRKK